ncbi:hypothetical protein K439DRAFT_957819 [Ramaria rubella]|nr:hypothetical protein K439DRAFT_957819 [Ramaria rubella]
MVDYGSQAYFDPTSLAIPEDPPPQDEASPLPSDPSWQAHGDLRFSQYNGGGGGGHGSMSHVSTPPRASLRLQHQQQPHPHAHQQHPQHPLNGQGHGHGNGLGMGSPYPYGLANGRTAEHQHHQQHQQQQQQHPYAQSHQGQPHSFYDGSQVQGTPNGMGMVGAGSSMLGRQMGIGMGVEFGGPETPTPDVRRRTRSQQEGHGEMGW